MGATAPRSCTVPGRAFVGMPACWLCPSRSMASTISPAASLECRTSCSRLASRGLIRPSRRWDGPAWLVARVVDGRRDMRVDPVLRAAVPPSRSLSRNTPCKAICTTPCTAMEPTPAREAGPGLDGGRGTSNGNERSGKIRPRTAGPAAPCPLRDASTTYACTGAGAPVHQGTAVPGPAAGDSWDPVRVADRLRQELSPASWVRLSGAVRRAGFPAVEPFLAAGLAEVAHAR